MRELKLLLNTTSTFTSQEPSSGNPQRTSVLSSWVVTWLHLTGQGGQGKRDQSATQPNALLQRPEKRTFPASPSALLCGPDLSFQPHQRRELLPSETMGIATSPRPSRGAAPIPTEESPRAIRVSSPGLDVTLKSHTPWTATHIQARLPQAPAGLQCRLSSSSRRRSHLHVLLAARAPVNSP